jgi:hypothetical protein
MRKLLLTTLTLFTLQTPVFAQVKVSNNDLYRLGVRNGILYCAALRNGVRTNREMSVMITNLRDPENMFLGNIWDRLTQAQKKVVFAGTNSVVSYHCKREFNVFMQNN